VAFNLSITGCGPLFHRADIFECRLDYTPSQNLVDAYLVIDQATGKAVRSRSIGRFHNSRAQSSVTAPALGTGNGVNCRTHHAC